ncbi:MAG: hypothetical protein IJZ39_13605 [Oscillospiraceae bacterium]|nr:hypothetical protein [Oscillospiraceae bacterium]MBQ8239167.1 hypothetical protein [Oscillospiraceae bacterium]
MKKLSVLILALVCLLAFTGCCFHREWTAATCTTPKTCVECGETEGEALGHTWADATCETPKTCETCRETEGEALGHAWVDATTEAPKTCTTCAATEGERIVTDERFTTASTIDLQDKWTAELALPSEMLGIQGFDASLTIQISMDFGNDGTMKMGYTVANEDEFSAGMINYLATTLYDELAAEGLNKEEADAAMTGEYGMTVEEFAASAVAEMDFAAIFEAMSITGVYYVDGDQLYTGISWDMAMEPSSFTLEGDTLTLAEELSGLSEESLVFTRVSE